MGHPGKNRTSNPGMNLNIVSQSSMALSFIKTLAAVGKEKGEAGQKSASRTSPPSPFLANFSCDLRLTAEARISIHAKNTV